MELQELYRQATTLHQKGELDAAGECCRKILQHSPENPKALHRLGFIAWQKKNYAEAVSLMRRAISLSPTRESFHNNLGNVLKDIGQKAEALESFQEALRLNPRYAGVYMNLGAVYQELNRSDEAIQAYEQYLGFHSEDVNIRMIAITLLRRQKRFDRAIRHCKEILRINPGMAEAYNTLGGLFFLIGQLDQAEAAYRKALEKEPENPQFHANLALALSHKRKPREALALLQKAQALAPGHANSKVLLSKLHLEFCQWDHREEDIATIIEFLKDHLCGNAREELEPWTLFQIPSERDFQIEVAREKARFYEESAEPFRKALAFSHAGGERPARLKIGYVSPDFRNHAVGLLIHRMFGFHDRNRFEVYCYNLTRFPGDFVQQSVREGADHFIELANFPAAKIAEAIYRDGIHILVDLAGYTTFSRPEIFALRPAPIQVQYLGYLDTMAADFIHYTIADHVVIDPKSAGEYSEKIVYMPHTYAVFSGFPAAEKPVSRSDCGLPDEGIVFCCFNTSYKIDPEVFDSWMRILSAVDGSVLWLLSSSDELLEQNLRKEANKRGVDPARLIIAEWTSVEEHTARSALADLFLDTFIYNAGTTAVQVLSAGVSVLTLKRPTFLRRMGASLLTAAGMPELICHSPKEYEDKAIDLALHPEKLKTFHDLLLNKINPPALYNTESFVADLERAYNRMWENYLQGVREDIDLAETP